MAAPNQDVYVLNRKVDELALTVQHISRQFSQYLEGYYARHPKDLKAREERRTDFSKDENEERGNWSGRLDFLLACLGYAVGLGNVWRFPYLCYKNGGAVFFIPYVIMLAFVGMPIFFMELSLGQYTSSGPLTCWEFARIFKGIGVGMVVVSALVGIYYNMIIAWALYYLFASFTSDLPWRHCDREWNTPLCADNLQNVTLESCVNSGLNASVNGVCYNGTNVYGIFNETAAGKDGISAVIPSAEYFNFELLKMQKDGSTTMDNLGTIHWELVLCLLLAWIIVCLSLIKGIKSSGKVVYFTALFPYVVLVILAVRGFTLEGHYQGIEYYILNVDWSRLYDAQVWKEAAVQIFFSLSASWGGLIALSSYNRFHNDCLRDSMIVSLGNCLTSFFAGFVVFSFLGFLANQYNKEVGEVVQGGVGLAFIVYPAAVLELPVPQLWAFLFFGMLITLGLDSEFALVETVTTAIMDQFPKLRQHKAAVIGIYSLLMFLLGLTLCTDGGSLLLTLMDSYSGGWNVLLIAILECVGIAYVYGAFRFRDDIRVMIGPTGCGCFAWKICFPWWMMCWSFFTPIVVLFVMVFSWIDYAPLEDGGYVFPVWANSLGWCMTFTVIIGIIVTPIILFCMTPGSFGERLRYLTKPTEYWGPALTKHRRLVQHLPDFVIDPLGDGGTEEVGQNDIKVHDDRWTRMIDYTPPGHRGGVRSSGPLEMAPPAYKGEVNRGYTQGYD